MILDTSAWLPRHPDARRVQKHLLFALRFLSVAGMLLATIGCDHRTLPDGHRFETERGITFTALPKPTPGAVRLSLWIDAGSRDATLPPVATVTAWSALGSANASLDARVFPDATEFTALCAKPMLESCLGHLARAISQSPRVRHIEQANARFHAARAGAARDLARATDMLAIEALFGSDARGMNPLGGKPTDKPVGAPSVRAFMRDHYGAGRVLLIASGDISHRELRKSVRKLRSLRPSRRRAKRRRANESSRSESSRSESSRGVALRYGGTARQLSMVAQVSTTAQARLMASLLSRPSFGLVHQFPHASLHAFGIRGRGLLMARLAPPQNTRHAVEQLVHLTSRAYLRTGQASDRSGSARLLSDRDIGFQWAHAASSATQSGLRFGVGMMLPIDGKTTRTEEDVTEETVAAWVDGATRWSTPQLRGEMNDRSARVQLENGASLRIQIKDSPHIAIAVRFAKETTNEPHPPSGRAALLATALAACPRRDSIELLPWVHSDGFGIRVRAPASRWRHAVDVALECALRPHLDAGQVQRARLALLSALTDPTTDASKLAIAETALGPHAPTSFAILGSAQSIERIRAQDLPADLSAARTGNRITVGVVGPMPVEAAARQVARWLAPVTPAEAKASSSNKASPNATAHHRRPSIEVRPAPSPTAGEPHRPSFRDVVLVWKARRASGEPACLFHRAGARAFAENIARLLSEHGPWEVQWHAADVDRDHAWAATGLRLRSAQSLAPALALINKFRLPQRESLEAAHTREAWQQRDVGRVAMSLVSSCAVDSSRLRTSMAQTARRLAGRTPKVATVPAHENEDPR